MPEQLLDKLSDQDICDFWDHVAFNPIDRRHKANDRSAAAMPPDG